MATESTNMQQTLNERGKTHGDFLVNTITMQAIKDIMHNTPNWNKLLPHQKEALEMNAHKIGRILCGDPNKKDHWVDIAGYATLVANELGD